MDLKIEEMAKFLPKHWTPSDLYEKQLYVLIDLDPTDDHDEYEKVLKVNTLSKPLSAIKRIQHPIAYLRYLVQTEYLKFAGKHFGEKHTYLFTDKSRISRILNFNCDKRYAINSFLENDANCRVDDGLENFENFLIICNERTDSGIETDKNYYPCYLLCYAE